MIEKGQNKQRLGRGLAMLLGDGSGDGSLQQTTPATGINGYKVVPIELLKPSSNNPRKYYAKEELEELAASIRHKGILQPILVRPLNIPGAYEETLEIVAGERRWRAAQLAGLVEVGVIIERMSDRQALEIAVIENVQRSDLSPLEEARGYSLLMNEYEYTQNELADSIGKSRSHVANMLRLLKLPQDIQTLLDEGKLTTGHARALINTEAPSALAKRIIAKNLNVRQAEELANTTKAAPVKSREKSVKPEKDDNTLALEQHIGERIGMRVDINHEKGSEAGEIRIHYLTLDQLDLICQKLGTTF